MKKLYLIVLFPFLCYAAEEKTVKVSNEYETKNVGSYSKVTHVTSEQLKKYQEDHKRSKVKTTHHLVFKRKKNVQEEKETDPEEESKKQERLERRRRLLSPSYTDLSKFKNEKAQKEKFRQDAIGYKPENLAVLQAVKANENLSSLASFPECPF